MSDGWRHKKSTQYRCAKVNRLKRETQRGAKGDEVKGWGRKNRFRGPGEIQSSYLRHKKKAEEGGN